MRVAVKSPVLALEAAIDAVIARARDAGLAHVALRLSELPSDDACRAVATRLRHAGLALAAVQMPGDPAASLPAAAALGSPVVTADAGRLVPPAEPASPARTDEQLFLLRRALLDERWNAEETAVVLAVRVGPDTLLRDPAAARDFLDDLTTPWVAACLSEASSPVCFDWISTLGPRLAIIEMPAPPAPDDPCSMVLDAARFDGVILV